MAWAEGKQSDGAVIVGSLSNSDYQVGGPWNLRRKLALAPADKHVAGVTLAALRVVLSADSPANIVCIMRILRLPYTPDYSRTG